VKLRITLFLFCFLISGLWFQAPAHAACFNPAGNAGDMRYNGGYRVKQYCNGGNWVSMGGPVGNTASGLVGWWKLDETSGTSASDSTGNGNTGTTSGSPAWTTGGMVNGALTITGAQYVAVPDVASLQLAGSWTVSSWVNFSALPGSNGVACMIQKTNTTGNNYELCYANNFLGTWSGLMVYFAGTLGSEWAESSSAISLNTWYLVTGVWDSSSNYLYLYVNGSLVASAHSGDPPLSGGGVPLHLGNGQYTNAPINGTMDDARIYNRALSAADIKTLYTSTGGTSGDINSNLVGYWKLDEASGTVAADSSGNSNTGTTYNSPTWAAGKINNALTFNGTTQYVSVPDVAGLRFGTGDFTVAAWINFPLSASAYFAGIVSKGYSTTAPAHTWGLVVGSPGNNFVSFQDTTDAGGAWGDCNINSGFVAAGWHHIAVTRTGGTCTIYTDAAVVFSSGSIPGGSDPIDPSRRATCCAVAAGGRDSVFTARPGLCRAGSDGTRPHPQRGSDWKEGRTQRVRLDSAGC
jgi:Concanavalin A-like lectin/glucanases superfamily